MTTAAAESASGDRGEQLFALVEELYPLCRSITGNGTRATLDVIERLVPLRRSEVPTGRKVFATALLARQFRVTS